MPAHMHHDRFADLLRDGACSAKALQFVGAGERTAAAHFDADNDIGMLQRGFLCGRYVDHAHIGEFTGSRDQSDPRDVEKGENPRLGGIDDVAAEPFETVGAGRAGIDGRGDTSSETESVQVDAPM